MATDKVAYNELIWLHNEIKNILPSEIFQAFLWDEKIIIPDKIDRVFISTLKG